MPLVNQYMNTHLVYLREGDRVEIALGPILEFGLSAVPVLDDEHKPIGMVSLRELAASRALHPHAIPDAKTIPASDTLEAAARLMAQHNVHHLVAVDPQGAAVGMLSSLDIVRAFGGLAPQQPVATRRFALQADGDVQSEFVR